MDFLNRSNNANQPQSGRAPTTPVAPTAASHQPQHNDKGFKGNMNWSQPGWLRVTFVILLFSAAGLGIALALLLNKGSSANENTYINTSNYQAVFLTNGQVYFGKVQGINKAYVDLTDVYYLNSQQAATDPKATTTTEPSSFSLVKLGCELHGPNDQMLINRDQVTFWENLKTDRQVAKAIAEWQKQNPDGQKCQDTAAAGTQQAGTATGTQEPATDKKP